MGLSAAVVLAFVGPAHAARKNSRAAKEACAAAYVQTQELRAGGFLQRARAEALTCAQPGCPRVLRKDCQGWFDALQDAVPTVVLDIRTGKNSASLTGRVSLDGAPWLEVLPVTAVPIDPGIHRIRVELNGGGVFEKRVIVREGQHAVPIVFDFPKARRAPADVQAQISAERATAAAEGPPTIDKAAPTKGAAGRSSATSALDTVAWLCGGGAVLGAAGAAYFGVVGKSDEDDMLATCAPDCDKRRVDSVQAKFYAADALMIGSALVAALGMWAWWAGSDVDEQPAAAAMIDSSGRVNIMVSTPF